MPPYSALGPFATKPYAMGERPGGSDIPTIPLLSGEEAWDSLLDYYPRKGMDSIVHPVKLGADCNLNEIAETFGDRRDGTRATPPSTGVSLFSEKRAGNPLAKFLSGLMRRAVGGAGKVAPKAHVPRVVPPAVKTEGLSDFANLLKSKSPGVSVGPPPSPHAKFTSKWRTDQALAAGGKTPRPPQSGKPSTAKPLAGEGGMSTAGPLLAGGALGGGAIAGAAKLHSMGQAAQADVQSKASPVPVADAAAAGGDPADAGGTPDAAPEGQSFMGRYGLPIAGGTVGLLALAKLLHNKFKKRPEDALGEDRERWESLPKMASIDPERFGEEFPMVSGCLVRCAEAGLGEDEIEEVIKVACAQSPEVAAEFEKLAAGPPAPKPPAAPSPAAPLAQAPRSSIGGAQGPLPPAQQSPTPSTPALSPFSRDPATNLVGPQGAPMVQPRVDPNNIATGTLPGPAAAGLLGKIPTAVKALGGAVGLGVGLAGGTDAYNRNMPGADPYAAAQQSQDARLDRQGEAIHARGEFNPAQQKAYQHRMGAEADILASKKTRGSVSLKGETWEDRETRATEQTQQLWEDASPEQQQQWLQNVSPGLDQQKLQQSTPEQQQAVVAGGEQLKKTVEERGVDPAQVQSELESPGKTDADTVVEGEIGAQTGVGPEEAAAIKQQMDPASQFLLWGGLALGVIGLISALADDEGGLMPWIMTLLGVGMTGAGAAGQGMLGQGAQSLMSSITGGAIGGDPKPAPNNVNIPPMSSQQKQDYATQLTNVRGDGITAEEGQGLLADPQMRQYMMGLSDEELLPVLQEAATGSPELQEQIDALGTMGGRMGGKGVMTTPEGETHWSGRAGRGWGEPFANRFSDLARQLREQQAQG